MTEGMVRLGTAEIDSKTSKAFRVNESLKFLQGPALISAGPFV